jgi:MFS family permease
MNRNVYLVGFTSLMTDISSEMVYPLYQAFVRMILATQQALIGPVLGVIEGLAESTAALTKVFAGYYSDRFQKRKSLAITGYSTSSAGKLFLFFAAFGWYFVLLSRFIDRVGKGIRTAPRDALIAESIDESAQGKAFGLHRAMDFFGATIGTLISYFIVLMFLDSETGNLQSIQSFYYLFALSIIPALIGIAFLTRVRETGRHMAVSKPKPNLDIRKYNRNLKVFFIVQMLFTLGNSSNQFLLLRSMDLGYSLATVILMYMVFNLSTSGFSTFFGSLSDTVGRKKILTAGYVLYAVVYSAFGFLGTDSKILLWGFWILYGIYYAMTEGVEKAFVAGLAPVESKATALGFYHTIIGVGLLPASIIAGLLFAWLPSAPFVLGGVLALVAAGILGCCIHEK